MGKVNNPKTLKWLKLLTHKIPAFFLTHKENQESKGGVKRNLQDLQNK